MFRTGLWTIARWRGIPIRLHWSIPVGAFFLGRMEFVPGFWVGFVLLVLVHELGHAFLAQRRRLAVYEVQVHGLGGVCAHRSGSPFDNSIVAWGGVLAQLLVLFVPAFVTMQFVAMPNAFLREMMWALTETNLFIAGINLIPIEPLDGAKAWQLPKLWWQRRKRLKKSYPKQSSAARTKALQPIDGVAAERTAQQLAQAALDDAKRKH